ncbi:hypothetical protein QBZ16_005152 [Prototheca wickerhamii]|uniref:RING-type domain-containing protein n=1 Tax=Prototheca wickerhamii TaxID=3111 RepID=A0AAD9IEM9_PROWI|nr:hypothetical protein QBZ16_005152 [Prototheca wickerhamii]
MTLKSSVNILFGELGNVERGASTGAGPGKYARLIEAVLDQRNGSGLTALMLACQRGHASVAACLLEQGADPTLVEPNTMRSCLHYAALGGHVQCLRLLCADETRWAPRALPGAAPGSPPPAPVPLRDVILHDVQVGQAKFIDLRSYGGLTPLHCCVVTGRLDAVRVLLLAGAAIMVRTDGDAYVGAEFLVPGSTPLHMAVLVGHASIAHALLQAHQTFMGAVGGALDARGRRAWEGSSRSDVRSVRNSLRRLPYHLARERGFAAIQALVDPRVPIDVALDGSRDSTAGIGPKRLSTLCSVRLQQALLAWLDEREREAELEEAKTKVRGEAEALQRRAASGTGRGVLALARSASRSALEAVLRTPEASPREEFVAVSSGNTTTTTNEEGSGARSSAFAAIASLPSTPARPSTDARPSTQPQPGSFLALHVPGCDDGAAPAVGRPRLGAHARSTSAAGEMFGLAPPRGATNNAARARAAAPTTRTGSVRRQASAGLEAERSDWTAFRTASATRPAACRAASGADLGPGSAAVSRAMANALLGIARGGVSPPPPPPPAAGSFSAGSSPLVLPGGQGAAAPDGSPLLVLRSGSLSAGGAASACPPSPGAEDDKLRAHLGDKDLSSLDGGSCSGVESCEEVECGICLDRKVEVAFAGCEHALCLTCARHLTQAGKKPPHCPFCRRMVVGFTRVTPVLDGQHGAHAPSPDPTARPLTMIVDGVTVN